MPGYEQTIKRYSFRREFKGGGAMGVLTGLLTACSGFLLAVLWMDLIFDSQIRAAGRRVEQLPEPALASIAGYYHRATTTSQPMGRLIALVMIVLLGALLAEALVGDSPGVANWRRGSAGGRTGPARDAPHRAECGAAGAGAPTPPSSRPGWPGRSTATTSCAR